MQMSGNENVTFTVGIYIRVVIANLSSGMSEREAGELPTVECYIR